MTVTKTKVATEAADYVYTVAGRFRSGICMMRPRRLRGEGGASLVLALAFLTLFGVTSVALLVAHRRELEELEGRP